MPLPTAIIFINADAVGSRIQDGYNTIDGYTHTVVDGYTKVALMMQLYINEFMTDKEFDARVVADPNYPTIVHLQGKRILVARADFRDYTNRDLADLVLFYSHGLATVEKTKYGPPGLTLPVDRINIYELLRDVGSKYVVILPVTATRPPHCGIGGIVVDELADSSGVHDANLDNEYNNPDFINRK